MFPLYIFKVSLIPLISHRSDGRTRKDRVQIQVDAFSAQLEEMTQAYMQWSIRQTDSLASLDLKDMPEGHEITVIDLFCEMFSSVYPRTDTFVGTKDFVLPVHSADAAPACSLVYYELIPFAPDHNKQYLFALWTFFE